MPQPVTENTLFYGDNLPILREYIPTESVDLVYLDPPFNSNRNYNVLFKDERGTESEAQITAFEDTWHWNHAAQETYDELRAQARPEVGKMIEALHDFVGANQMMAYLVMMAARLVELHRVLKPTGSLYLHCDPTASHYLKVILDTIFGAEQFRNEIIWKRTSAHSDAKQGDVKHMGRIHDVVLFYTKSNAATRNELYRPLSDEYVSSMYRHVDEQGRRYRLDNLTGPGGAAKGNPQYEFLGVTRYWRYSKERMQALYEQGRVVQTKPGTVPAYKRYLDETRGVPLQDEWDDIPPIGSSAAERLGYPTQKPLALLERIIEASSNPGDWVIDPFCVTGDTLIVTKDGLKPIAKVQAGDEVLTHTGFYRKVLRRYERDYEGPILNIHRARSTTDIQITPNHPVLAVRAMQCPYENRRCLPRTCHYHEHGRHLTCPLYRDAYKAEWIEAGDLKEGDWVYYPDTHIEAPALLQLPDSSHHNAKKLATHQQITPELMEWLGYFAAEGFVDQNSVHFANYECAERIAELGSKLFGLLATITPQPYRSKHIRFNSRALSLWLEKLIGRGAAHKKLPEWVFGLDQQCRHALLRGLLLSDGSFRQDKLGDASHSYRYGSASPTLSHQIWRLMLADQLSAGFLTSHPNPVNRQINGIPIRVNHPSYRVEVYDVQSVNCLLEITREAPRYEEAVTRKPYDSYPFGDGHLFSIKSIRQQTATTTVYNLEVEEDHSYVTAHFTVHNCGCGTAIAAAQKLGRKWIGIDITFLSIALQKNRMKGMFGDIPYKIIGVPEDIYSARELALADRYQFQWWALSLVDARPQGGQEGSRTGKMGSDKGIDGTITFIDDASGKAKRVIVQVKSGHVSSRDIRDLVGTIDREKAAIGVFITLEKPTGDMVTEGVKSGAYASPDFHGGTQGKKYPRIQILTIEQLLSGAEIKMPPPGLTYKQAQKIQEAAQTTFDLPGE